MRKKKSFIACLLIASTLLFSPQTKAEVYAWTLDSCISYALEHNISIKKEKLSLAQAEESSKLAKAQLYPSLSASISESLKNPSENMYAGSYGLNASLSIYEGGSRSYTIKQRSMEEELQQLGIELNEDNVIISITQAYLMTLYAKESVLLKENALTLADSQRVRAKELYAAGSQSKSDYLQMESEYSDANYQLVSAQADLDNYLLELKQLLELGINDELSVDYPNIDETDILGILPDKESVYRTSIEVMPQIKSSQLSISIAEIESKKAKSGYYPNLSLNAGVGTSHASGYNTAISTQIQDNLNESLSLSLSIPIASKRANKSAKITADINLENSKLELQESEKNLLKTVEGIYLDAQSAQTSYLAAKEKLKLTEVSYSIVEEQYNLGLVNTVDMLSEKNNLLSAQQQMLQAKFLAILNISLLEFYQGNTISLNYN